MNNVPTATIQLALPHVESKRLRLLGVGSLERYPCLPDLPTLAESGVKGYEALQWYGVMTPAGTPRAIVDKLSVGLQAIVNNDGVRALLQPGHRAGRLDAGGVRRRHQGEHRRVPQADREPGDQDGMNFGRRADVAMGKGGVGKTTLAAAIAVELAHRGLSGPQSYQGPDRGTRRTHPGARGCDAAERFASSGYRAMGVDHQ